MLLRIMGGDSDLLSGDEVEEAQTLRHLSRNKVIAPNIHTGCVRQSSEFCGIAMCRKGNKNT